MSMSECSSGCESGWTAYLDHSSNSTHDEYKYTQKSKRVALQEDGDDDDEDLSMVSDASSGPRHYSNYEEEDNNEHCLRYYSYCVSPLNPGKMTKINAKKDTFEDTASSPVYSFSKKKLALSSSQAGEQETQGFSTTHYKLQGKSSLNQHFEFLKSSVSGKEFSKKSGDMQGRDYI